LPNWENNLYAMYLKIDLVSFEYFRFFFFFSECKSVFQRCIDVFSIALLCQQCLHLKGSPDWKNHRSKDWTSLIEAERENHICGTSDRYLGQSEFQSNRKGQKNVKWQFCFLLFGCILYSLYKFRKLRLTVHKLTSKIYCITSTHYLWGRLDFDCYLKVFNFNSSADIDFNITLNILLRRICGFTLNCKSATSTKRWNK
jgi:hypothetical protein